MLFSDETITKPRLFKYIENFTTSNCNFFQIKSSDIIPISAENIECGYPLEPPRRAEIRKIMYTERKKKRRVNFIPKFHSSLKKFVKYFTMITKRYMFQISLVCDQQVSSY